MAKLTKEEVRVLRILEKQPAVEQAGHELRSLIGVCASGLASYGPWEEAVSRTAGRYRTRTIRITPAGRRALESSHDR